MLTIRIPEDDAITLILALEDQAREKRREASRFPRLTQSATADAELLEHLAHSIEATLNAVRSAYSNVETAA